MVRETQLSHRDTTGAWTWCSSSPKLHHRPGVLRGTCSTCNNDIHTVCQTTHTLSHMQVTACASQCSPSVPPGAASELSSAWELWGESQQDPGSRQGRPTHQSMRRVTLGMTAVLHPSLIGQVRESRGASPTRPIPYGASTDRFAVPRSLYADLPFHALDSWILGRMTSRMLLNPSISSSTLPPMPALAKLTELVT
jgi:hypothetical protein